MGQNFIACDREQVFLMPPDVREWLPESHLAWFVIDAVEALDLAAFYCAYRADGHGRPAYEPAMMVALLLYAYARGIRSSRVIERACEEDAAYGEARGDELPPELASAQGRRKWLREAQRGLDRRRAEEARPVPRSRPARLKEAKRRLDEELFTECQANAAYEAYRARGVM